MACGQSRHYLIPFTAVVTHSQSLLGTTLQAQSFAKGCKSLRDEKFISVHDQTWAKAVNSEWVWPRGFSPCCEFCSWILSFAVHRCWSNGPRQNPIQFTFMTILRPLAVGSLLSQHCWEPHSKLSPVLKVQRRESKFSRTFLMGISRFQSRVSLKDIFFSEAKMLLIQIFGMGGCLRRLFD